MSDVPRKSQPGPQTVTAAPPNNYVPRPNQKNAVEFETTDEEEEETIIGDSPEPIEGVSVPLPSLHKKKKKRKKHKKIRRLGPIPDEEEEEEEEEEAEDEEEEGDEEEDGSEEEDEGEEEEAEYIDSDDILSDEGPPISPFMYYPSEEGFKESNLASRRKRRYVIGTHSFLELTDPKLEKALLPGTGEEVTLSTDEKKRRGLKAERDNYKDKCKELGISPNATFLSSLGSAVLDLKGHGLTEKEIEAICKTLVDDTHFQRVLLGGNAAGLQGGLAIAEMIENNVYIEELDLCSTEILEAMEAIGAALEINTSIQILDLSKNELRDDEMFYVGSFLEVNNSLEDLNLSFNKIKDKGLRDIGYGLLGNICMISLDLSSNYIRGKKKANVFFNACAEHPRLCRLNLARNVIRNDGAKGIGTILGKNKHMDTFDVSSNIMEEPAGPVIGRVLNFGPRDLETLHLEQQWWHQQAAALVLRPLGNPYNEMPITLIDFGYLLDVHTAFLKVKEKVQKLRPDLKIIHGEPYGFGKAKGPDPKALVIRRANVVCENFETPLVLLMEELAKEPPKISSAAFKKFIKQCNLYKDKTVTEAFEKVFPAGLDVDAAGIIEAFDKEYPGLRKIPKPEPEDENKEEKPKKEKKKKGGKGKGKGKKGKGGKKGKKEGDAAGEEAPKDKDTGEPKKPAAKSKPKKKK